MIIHQLHELPDKSLFNRLICRAAHSMHITIVENRELLEEIDQNTKRLIPAHEGSFLYNAPMLAIISTVMGDDLNTAYSNAAIMAQNMVLASVDSISSVQKVLRYPFYKSVLRGIS